MRKTLYLDNDSNEILNTMPAKKQSEFARDSIKFLHKHKLNKEQDKQEKPKNHGIKVKIIG